MQESTKNLQQVLRATERSAAAAEVMQTLLAGTLAFNILDQLTGVWDITGNTPALTVDWGTKYLQDPLIGEIGRWFGVSMVAWFLLGWALLAFMQRLADANKSIIIANVKLVSCVFCEHTVDHSQPSPHS